MKTKRLSGDSNEAFGIPLRDTRFENYFLETIGNVLICNLLFWNSTNYGSDSQGYAYIIEVLVFWRYNPILWTLNPIHKLVTEDLSGKNLLFKVVPQINSCAVG